MADKIFELDYNLVQLLRNMDKDLIYKYHKGNSVAMIRFLYRNGVGLMEAKEACISFFGKPGSLK